MVLLAGSRRALARELIVRLDQSPSPSSRLVRRASHLALAIGGSRGGLTIRVGAASVKYLDQVILPGGSSPRFRIAMPLPGEVEKDILRFGEVWSSLWG